MEKTNRNPNPNQSQENTANNPIGINLTCKVCGLLKSNHDCELELANPKPIKPRPTLQELLWGNSNKVVTPSTRKPETESTNGVALSQAITPKKKSKVKAGLATFYAWENKSGEICKQRGFKELKSKEYGKKGADLYSIAKFSKGGNGTNRNLENFISVGECYSDLDPDFPLEWQEIVEKAKGLPLISKIVRSRSTHHYQVHWYIPDVEKKGLDLWLLIQEKIFELFRELGADPLAVKDPIRYLRDPGKYEIVYSNDRETTLSELYQAFKKNGSIKPVERQDGLKPRKRYQQSFDKVTLPLLRAFFTDNPNYKGSHKSIYSRLGIAKSTYFNLALPVLVKMGLNTETFRKGKTWITQFTFSRSNKRVFNTGGVGSGVYFRALGQAKRVGISENYRNVGVFVLALWLYVYKKLAPERILAELDPVFVAISSRGVGFSRGEFEKTVKSACRDRYKYFAGFKNKNGKLECLIAGLSNLQSENLDHEKPHV